MPALAVNVSELIYDWNLLYPKSLHPPGPVRLTGIAKVAMARRLAVGLYWMWRKGWNYEQWKKFGSHAGQLGTGDGVQ